MESRATLKIVLVIATLLWTARVRAGTTSPDARAESEPHLMLSLGLGASSLDMYYGGAIHARHGRILFGARYTHTSEAHLFGPFPLKSDTDLGLLVGRYVRWKRGYLSASSGLAVVRSIRRGALLPWYQQSPGGLSRYETISHLTVGLPLEAKIVRSSKQVGVGLEVFGNVNRRASFVGAALTLELGDLR